MDDAISGYINTPENLMKIAPGLNWVPPPEYPKSTREALQEMKQLRQDVDSIILVVKEGNLTSAGVELLRIIPRITVDGRVIIRKLYSEESTSMKAYRVENALNELLTSLGGVDVLLGQAINGQMGSITMAQIQCLEELNAAIQSFDDLFKAIPPNMS
jgi:cell division GTPase FtsZ